MEPYQQEAVLKTLVKNFGAYLWGIGLMKGKGSYEQRLEHAELLLEKVLGTFPEIGQRVAEKIEEL